MMKRFFLASLVLGLAVSGCSKKSGEDDTLAEESRTHVERAAERASERAQEWSVDRARRELNDMSVDQLATALADKTILPVDVNSAATRAEFGTIPGATLLSSASDITQLPENRDTALVFYCANPNCTAAPAAAAAARVAGYKNVSLLSAGIQGWVDAGQEVAPVPAPDDAN